MPLGQFKHRYSLLPFADALNTVSLGIITLFEKPLLTVISNIGEDVQYR
jgi:hypothetical protein